MVRPERRGRSRVEPASFADQSYVRHFQTDRTEQQLLKFMSTSLSVSKKTPFPVLDVSDHPRRGWDGLLFREQAHTRSFTLADFFPQHRDTWKCPCLHSRSRARGEAAFFVPFKLLRAGVRDGRSTALCSRATTEWALSCASSPSPAWERLQPQRLFLLVG